MKRWIALAAALVVLAAAAQRAGAQDAKRPNVLFIAIDDLNDWVGPLGGHPQVKTPNMDRLGARGTVFTNAHCQAPLCNPSRTSLLTGLRPSTTGVYGLAPWVRTVEEFRDVVSLPQHFMANGYTTYSTGKIWHGGYPPAKARPKESKFWGPGASVGAKPPKKLIPPTPGGNHPLMDWGTFPHKDQDKGDWKVASWAVDQLEQKPQEPYFLACGFFLPHVPCYVTQKWYDMYPDEKLQMPPIKDDDRDDTPEFSWFLHWNLPEPRLSWLRANHQDRNLVRSYLASISFVDSQVGRLLDALEKSGTADNTIVVLWADHGYHLGEKLISGKNTIWERSSHVPLIFAGPGVAQNARCNRTVELLDIYPTLIDLCGLPPQSHLEGHSVNPQLKDATAKREWPAITTHNQGNHAIRSEHYRYIRYGDGSQELYDLEADPNEWTNLAGDPKYAQVIAEHAKWLPKVDVPPAPGSKHRVLYKDGDRWIWEGKPIVPADKVE